MMANVRKGDTEKLIQQLQAEVESLRRKVDKLPEMEIVKGNKGESELSIKAGGTKTRVPLNSDDRAQTQRLQKDLDAKGNSIKNVKSIHADEGHFSGNSLYVGSKHISVGANGLEVDGKPVVVVPTPGTVGQVLKVTATGFAFEDEASS
jgi:hypothetical protein